MDEQVPSGIQEVMRFHERGEHLAALRQIDRRAMAGWSDVELAEWQSRWPLDSGPWRLSEHEWQRRLTLEAARLAGRDARNTALLSVALSFLSGGAVALLSGWLGVWLPKV